MADSPMGPGRFELPTEQLKAICSTIKLYTPICRLSELDSNKHHTLPKNAVLPLDYHSLPHITYEHFPAHHYQVSRSYLSRSCLKMIIRVPPNNDLKNKLIQINMIQKRRLIKDEQESARNKLIIIYQGASSRHHFLFRIENELISLFFRSLFRSFIQIMSSDQLNLLFQIITILFTCSSFVFLKFLYHTAGVPLLGSPLITS